MLRSQLFIEFCPINGLIVFYFSLQVVSQLRPIISAAAHLLGMKDVDNGKTVFIWLEWFIFILLMTFRFHNFYIHSYLFFLETQNSLLMLLRALAQQHTQEFENAVMSLPDEQKNKMTMAVTQS